jgi:hypothetical protein
VSGFVYFILATDSGRVKIGHTAGNPWERLEKLQTGNHERLQLFASIRGSARVERRLHDRFRGMREQGEWFAPGPELVGFMDGVRAADPSCIHREHLDRVVAEWRSNEVRWTAPPPPRAPERQLTEEEIAEQQRVARDGALGLLRALGIPEAELEQKYGPLAKTTPTLASEEEVTILRDIDARARAKRFADKEPA